MLKGLLFTLLIFSFLFFNSFSQGKRFSSDNPSNEELNPVSQSELTFDQTAPDGSAILPGSWMIGVLADVSFPFGDAFKNFAGTGFSGHLFIGYSVVKAFQVTMRVGYVKFGEKSQDFSFLGKIAQEGYTVNQNFSQVPILLGGYFTPELDPSCLGGPGSCFSGSLFHPYVGVNFGMFIQNYKWEQNYSYGGMTQTYEETESDTKFGIVPSVGSYYDVSPNIRLNLGLEWAYIFHEAEVGESNINYLSINFGGAYNF